MAHQLEMETAKDDTLLPTPPIPEHLRGRQVPLTENSRKVLERRYLRKGPDGKPVETILEMFWRVAWHVAEAEDLLEGDRWRWAETFFDMLTRLEFLPNSPTFTGAGTPLGQLAACFTADMRVVTDNGLKRIADLQVGDRVLTHRGRFRPVTETMQRYYNGPLYRIKIKLIGTTLEVTPEHPVLTSNGWVQVRQLKKGDKVAIGIPSYCAAIRPVDTTYVTPNASPTAQVNMPPLQSRNLIERVFGITLPEPDTRYVRSFIYRESEQVFFEIEHIEVVHFSGTVYNCEVDEDHTYVTEGVVVHNCFVLPIEDDMGKVRGGIFDTLRNAALIQQTGGGNGFSFSRLRPLGEHVLSSAGKATGPVGFLRVYDKAFGEIAQGGCLLPDTLVFTERGLLRLDEIVDPERPGWQPHTLRVATDEGWRSSPRGYNNGLAPVLRVHTREGISLTGTPEHRVKVMTDNGPEWRQLQELRPGDWLIVRLGEHRGRLQALRHPQPRHGNQIWPKLPSILDEELAFFLGYLAGDGFIATKASDHRIGVSVAHTSYLMEEMPALMERLFGVNVHRWQKPGDRSVTFVIDNRAVKEFLLLNGFDKPDSRSVCVPRLIRQSPPEVVGAYLRGLFEADGTLSHGYPTLMTTSKRLAKEVATLLIGLGCPVRIRTIAPGVDRWGDSETYQVRIHSTVGLKAWRERIGCDMRSRFVAAFAWESDQRRESSYVLPCPRYWLDPVLEAITLEQIDAKGRGRGIKFRSTTPALRRTLLRYVRGERNFTRSAYDELCRRFPEFAEHARSPEGLWFVQVTGVEPAGEALTLDLEVDENHTYLAYGIVTHNTRRGANMAVLRVDHPDIREFIRCKEKEGEIANFNISVAVTDDFMRAVENDEMWPLRFPDVHHPRYRDFRGTINQAEKAGIPINVYEHVRARELFDEIVRHAHHNGEPGVLFIDRANRDNPVPHLYELEATNPCVTGETLVATPDGWRPVSEIQVGDEIYTADGQVRRVARVEIYYDRPVYRVTFSDGGVIRATAAHQFHVWDEITERFVPTPLRELTEGACVRVYRPYPLTLSFASLQTEASQNTLPVAKDTLVEIVSIEHDGRATVYDLYEPVTDTWLPAGYVSRGCGEQWLGPYENCCLGSVNLAKHLVWEEGRARLDWEKLARTVHTATRFLDDVVTANKYVPAVPELREAAERARRIGLGIMGLADVLYALRVRYGSPEGQELAAQIMEWVRYHAMLASIELAQERGPFPAIDGSIYDPANLTWEPPTPLEPYTHDWGRPPVEWDRVVHGIRQHGIRNAAQTTIAPTGTLSTVSGVEGYGCEPVFALSYIRHVHEGDQVLDLYYFSPLFEQALTHEGIDAETRQRIKEKVALTGSCQDVPEVPEDLRHVFVVAQDITPEEHVYMQAALQRFVDNSISKCVTGDTLVLTPNGLVPIQEMGELRLPDQFADLDVEIISPEGREKANAFYYGGFRETRKVSLEYGFGIEGTPNHRVHVLDENGKVVFRALGELKPGDTVVLYSGQRAFGPPNAPLPAFSGTFRTNSTRIRFPERMSKELAFFLGCLTSEGAITRNGINIANTDRSLLETLREIAKRLFGLEGNIATDSRNDVCYLQLNSRPLRHWLVVDLGLQAGATQKIIPTCILQASEAEIGAFLRGLFLDGFMTRNGRTFGITLASQTLIRQLHVLLLNFGILATVRQTAERAWSLTVQGGELERLAEIIEFVEVWKNERLARRGVGRIQRYRNYSRLLPAEVTRALSEMQASATSSLRSRYEVTRTDEAKAYQRTRVNLLQGHRLERHDALRLYKALRNEGVRHPFADAFFAHDDDQKIYVRVEKVEAGFSEVFDISVPGSHTFIANGLGNHNTINFPEHATVDDVAKAYFLAWKLGCKGITVYVTGSREQVVLETKKTLLQKQQPRKVMVETQPKARPRRLQGATYFIHTPLGKAYVTINRGPDGEPFEVFANVGKAGSDIAAVSEAIGRLISLILRLPSPMTPTQRLEEVVDQLSGIGGGRHLGFGAKRILSLPDALAQVLREDLLAHADQNGQRPVESLPPEPSPVQPELFEGVLKADLCPDCGHASLVNEEGCRKCYSCGYSEC